ncbi:amidohydrolase [Pochonia chlamydosporia 170]|uniref:Peptidase M20 domain-containing protein 2 n=1 Tax=Pochonia chlamydosporia 170 TaxID=1380566 RepID=A0A179EX14_METCM|nr:amidohydrolase [Pochonia chlamydosporia 170]OAQ57560.1 amidohydrolase [Pochonia chlamydosporia 170]
MHRNILFTLAIAPICLANNQSSLNADIFAAIDKREAQLAQMNREILEHPELAYNEVYAHEILTSFLKGQGFNVTRKAYNISTAFVAEYENGPGKSVSFNAEYDALKGMGHSCGHNLIATSGVAAAIGVKHALEYLGVQGRVVLLGTPAEETGGGKIRLLEAGAYDGLDCSLMAHPTESYTSFCRTSAAWAANVTWTGYGAHAGGAPWLGRNAMDGFVTAYTSTGLYRQQLQPSDRIHHIMSESSQLVNVIPDLAQSQWQVRGPSRKRRDVVVNHVREIIESSAKATNTSVKIEPTLDYWEVQSNAALSRTYYRLLMKNFDPSKDPKTANFTNPDVEEEIYRIGGGGGTTDQGNVSFKLPSIHVTYPISATASPHNVAFRAAAATDFAFVQAIRTAKILALTGVEVLRNETLAREIWKEFKRQEATPI